MGIISSRFVSIFAWKTVHQISPHISCIILVVILRNTFITIYFV
ncbi:hypothetical protein [Lysinibacillus xylanilyticus]